MQIISLNTSRCVTPAGFRQVQRRGLQRPRRVYRPAWGWRGLQQAAPQRLDAISTIYCVLPLQARVRPHHLRQLLAGGKSCGLNRFVRGGYDGIPFTDAEPHMVSFAAKVLSECKRWRPTPDCNRRNSPEAQLALFPGRCARSGRRLSQGSKSVKKPTGGSIFRRSG